MRTCHECRQAAFYHRNCWNNIKCRNRECLLTRRARGWHCCCDIPWITCETHSLVGFACGPRGGARAELSDPIDRTSLGSLLPVQRKPPKSVVEAQVNLQTRLRTEEVVNRSTSSHFRIRRPTVSLMGSIRDNQPRPKRWPKPRTRPVLDQAVSASVSIGSSRKHKKMHTSRPLIPPVSQRPLSAQETHLAVGRLRAIEPFPVDLPLHAPPATSSKGLQEKPAVALRMIRDRVPETPSTSSSSIPSPSGSRSLRRMNTDEAHLFAEGRVETTAASSSEPIVEVALPKHLPKPQRILERFDSEEAIKRL